MRAAAIQTTAGDDRDANLAAAGSLVEQAAGAGAELVVLPEYFSVAGTPEVLRARAESLDGPTMTWAATIAARLGIHLVAGSFPERPESGSGPDRDRGRSRSRRGWPTRRACSVRTGGRWPSTGRSTCST